MRRGQDVWAAKSIGKAQDPQFEIGGGAAGRGRSSEDDRLCAMLFADFQQPQCDGVECLFPGNLGPSRVRIALGPGSLHRVAESVVTLLKRPSSTIATTPHWAMHIGQ